MDHHQRSPVQEAGAFCFYRRRIRFWLTLLQRHSHLLISVSVIAFIAGLAISCSDKSPQSPVDIGSTIDRVPPAAVTDLHVRSPTRSSLALVWAAPGDDGTTGQAAMYDIRYSSSLITDQTWELAAPISDVPTPKPAGEIETIVITKLNSGAEYYFALKTYDEVPNESDLSNCASGVTVTEIDPPAAVSDLVAVAISGTEFLLTWTAPGDDGMLGTAAEYDIRFSNMSITDQNFAAAAQATGEPAPNPAGEPDSFVVSGLNAAFNYYFALKTADEIPNWSGISNKCPGLALSKFLMADPALVDPDDMYCDIYIAFRTTSPTQRAQITISTKSYEKGEIIDVVHRHLVDGSFPTGSHIVIWDWKDDEGEYFIWRFQHVTAKLYLDEVIIDNQPIRLDY